jgi:tetratricopeptide (TPR) repeat protein
MLPFHLVEVFNPMRWRLPLAALALVLLFNSLAVAQNTNTNSNTLRGKVRSPDGITVNNAIVELRFGGGGMIAQTVTRNDGDFAFSNLAPGEYEVAVMIAGYDPVVQVARFSQNDRMSFAEVLNIEVIIRPKKETTLSAPGTNFAQDVPKNARAAYERAIARLREGKSEEGVGALREAIATFNDYFDAHFALGKELFRQGKDDEALEALERARQINDRQDAVFYMFGLVMIKQRKYVIAEYAFREATRLNPNNVASRFYHGQTLIEIALRESDQRQRAADLNTADQELNRAWEASDKRLSAVYLQRARIHEVRGEKETAARDLESFLKAEPEAKNAPAIREAIARLRGANK